MNNRENENYGTIGNMIQHYNDYIYRWQKHYHWYLWRNAQIFTPTFDTFGYNERSEVTGAIVSNIAAEYGYDEIGVFIRDQYDFYGIQHLGYWNPNTNYVGKNPYKGSLVENKTFQIYRNSLGLGGDFYIYPDVKRIKLDKPINLSRNLMGWAIKL